MRKGVKRRFAVLSVKNVRRDKENNSKEGKALLNNNAVNPEVPLFSNESSSTTATKTIDSNTVNSTEQIGTTKRIKPTVKKAIEKQSSLESLWGKTASQEPIPDKHNNLGSQPQCSFHELLSGEEGKNLQQLLASQPDQKSSLFLQFGQTQESDNSQSSSIPFTQFNAYTPADQPITHRTHVDHNEELKISRMTAPPKSYPINRYEASLLGSELGILNSQETDTTTTTASNHHPNNNNMMMMMTNNEEQNHIYISGTPDWAFPFTENPFTTFETKKKLKRATIEMEAYNRSTSRLTRDFDFEGNLNKGSFGIVAKYRHRLDGHIYAIKRMKKPIFSKGRGIVSLGECHVLCTLTHPTIVRYYNSWIEEDNNCLHMQLEYCKGKNLYELFVEKKIKMSESGLIALIIQLAGALEHMHSKNIAHLDIKPENIILLDQNDDNNHTITSTTTTEAGNNNQDQYIYNDKTQFKLVDFGLAGSISNNKFTSNGEGDKKYIPVEALSDHISDLTKIDMFSLGATLYELALGEALPSSSMEWQQLRNGDIEDIPSISMPIQCMIRGLMDMNPVSRQSANAVLTAIKQYQRTTIQG